MQSNMENQNPTPPMDSFEREERCRKAIKTVSKAIFMRLFVTAILIWAVLQTGMRLWVLGLMVFVMIINLTGMLPLVSELKKRRKELNDIIAEEEI